MAGKKRKAGQPWWRKKRVQRQLAVAVSLALVIGVLAWLVVRGGGGGDSAPVEYQVDSAAPFTLPTVAGDEFSLSEHLGQDVVLLYFNEGMG